MLQVGYQISLFRFGIRLNNGSESNLNSPGWRTSPDPLLVLQSHFSIVNASGRTLNFPLQTWNLPKKWVWDKFARSWSEDVTWPAPGAQMTIFGIVNATGRITNFPLWIWNLPKKWVWDQLEWSWSEDVTWPASGGPNDYFGYSKCYNGDIEFPSSDLESQEMSLNRPDWRVSPDLLLVSKWLFWV